jgi:hypothetical protein
VNRPVYTDGPDSRFWHAAPECHARAHVWSVRTWRVTEKEATLQACTPDCRSGVYSLKCVSVNAKFDGFGVACDISTELESSLANQMGSSSSYLVQYV